MQNRGTSLLEFQSFDFWIKVIFPCTVYYNCKIGKKGKKLNSPIGGSFDTLVHLYLSYSLNLLIIQINKLVFFATREQVSLSVINMLEVAIYSERMIKITKYRTAL